MRVQLRCLHWRLVCGCSHVYGSGLLGACDLLRLQLRLGLHPASLHHGDASLRSCSLPTSFLVVAVGVRSEDFEEGLCSNKAATCAARRSDGLHAGSRRFGWFGESM